MANLTPEELTVSRVIENRHLNESWLSVGEWTSDFFCLTDRAKRQDGIGVGGWTLAFPCFNAIEPAEKSRFPLPLPCLVTSINARAERQDKRANTALRALRGTHKLPTQNTHTRNWEAGWGSLTCTSVLLNYVAWLHKGFVRVLLWVLTSCYLCPQSWPFVSADVSVYCLLSYETNCLVEAVILITAVNIYCTQDRHLAVLLFFLGTANTYEHLNFTSTE